jgi:hypothetical protein
LTSSERHDNDGTHTSNVTDSDDRDNDNDINFYDFLFDDDGSFASHVW